MRSTYTVETNKLGQVVRVRSVDASKNPGFDAITYGNVLQAFIRGADGTVIAGVYKLIYDYDPKTKNVHRGVALVQAGGVNPNAPGAVTTEMEKDAARQAKEHESASKNAKLPDFSSIVTPPPKP